MHLAGMKGTSLRVYGREIILNTSNAFPNDKIYIKPHPALLEPKTSSRFLNFILVA